MKKKCLNDSSKISFLGYTISKEGISPDQELMKKKKATPPNKKELESFLGLMNFYRQYVPKYTDLTEPFANLRKKNVEFKPVVKVFDPKKDITLTTDGSEHSISGILSQEE